MNNAQREVGSPVDDVKLIGFQDDTYAVGNAVQIATLWPHLQRALHDAGDTLNTAKSEFWLPGCDEVDTSNLPDEVATLVTTLPRASRGLKVLGNATQDSYESTLGPFALANIVV